MRPDFVDSKIESFGFSGDGAKLTGTSKHLQTRQLRHLAALGFARDLLVEQTDTRHAHVAMFAARSMCLMRNATEEVLARDPPTK